MDVILLGKELFYVLPKQSFIQNCKNSVILNRFYIYDVCIRHLWIEIHIYWHYYVWIPQFVPNIVKISLHNILFCHESLKV